MPSYRFGPQVLMPLGAFKFPYQFCTSFVVDWCPIEYFKTVSSKLVVNVKYIKLTYFGIVSRYLVTLKILESESFNVYVLSVVHG